MATKWNAKIQFPTDSNFVNRIIGWTFAPSNSKNPMVTIETEVISPQEVDIAGEMVSIAGVTCKSYYVTGVYDPAKQALDETKTSDKQNKFVQNVATPLGITKEEIDWNNLNTLKEKVMGKLVLTLMSPDEEEERANPTSDEIAQAKAKGIRPEGRLLKNPVTGKTLIKYWPKIREIFGLSPNQDGMQVPY